MTLEDTTAEFKKQLEAMMERQASSRLHARQQPSHLHTRTPSPLLDTTIRAPFDIETEEDDLIQRDLSRTALANVPKEILDEERTRRATLDMTSEVIEITTTDALFELNHRREELTPRNHKIRFAFAEGVDSFILRKVQEWLERRNWKPISTPMSFEDQFHCLLQGSVVPLQVEEYVI